MPCINTINEERRGDKTTVSDVIKKAKPSSSHGVEGGGGRGGGHISGGGGCRQDAYTSQHVVCVYIQSMPAELNAAKALDILCRQQRSANPCFIGWSSDQEHRLLYSAAVAKHVWVDGPCLHMLMSFWTPGHTEILACFKSC